MQSDEPLPARRALLLGALTISAGAALSTVLAACTPRGTTPGTAASTGSQSPSVPASELSGTAAGAHRLPQELAAIPQEFTAVAAQQGQLIELTYDTYESMTYQEGTRTLSKRAIIYLPHDYTADQQYNVFYLMHGGWSDETSTLGTPGNPSDLKNVFDHAIAAGEMEPVIIVCPTYNNTSPDDSGNFGLALTLNENYHRELLNDLLPAVESRYSTYAEDVSPEGLISSRDHRGFGGFSMGAVATWRAFQHGLDFFRYFLPMSCGTALDMDTILSAAQNHDDGYFVWVITGTDDFAHPYDERRVELLRTSRYFTETGTEQVGNFAFHVKDGYAHDGRAAMEYTYNGLRWFWTP